MSGHTHRVALQDMELWPVSIVAFPAWTGRDTPYEEREYVEVVRCRDCKHCKRRVDGYACGVRPLMQHVVEPDGYCSDGERREPESP